MTPSHADMAPTLFLEFQAFVGETLMTGPHYSEDINPTEHLRSILKRGAYEGEKHFNSKDALWNNIIDDARVITSCQIKHFA